MIVGADRDAAGEHEHVGLLEGRADGRARGLLGVGHGVGAQHAGARLGGQRGERRGVGVVQLARAQRAAGGDELVARGEDRQARGRGRRRSSRGRPRRRCRSRPRPCACRRRRTVCPALTSSPAGRRLRPGATSSSRVTVSPSIGHELDLEDGVGALGHGGAGRDADRLAVVQRDAGRRTGARLADDAQRAPRGARPHGEAVHRAVGERGHVALGRRRPRPPRGRARPATATSSVGSGCTAPRTFARASSIGIAMVRSSLPSAVGAGSGGRTSVFPRPHVVGPTFDETFDGPFELLPSGAAGIQGAMPEAPFGARRPHPVADVPPAALADGQAPAKGWLLALVAARPLHDAPALPMPDLARDAPGAVRGGPARGGLRRRAAPAGAAAATSPAWPRAPASWRARAGRRRRSRRSRRCAPRCGRR